MRYITRARQRQQHYEQHQKGQPKQKEISCLLCYPVQPDQTINYRFTIFWERYCKTDYNGRTHNMIDEFHRLVHSTNRTPIDICYCLYISLTL